MNAENHSNAEIVELARTVEALEARVASLEARVGAESVRDDEIAPPSDMEIPATTETPRAGSSASMLGRAVLVLAGAFLLRALTDTGVLTGILGVALGFGYVFFTIYLFERASRDERRAPAILHGLASILVAYPFIWETATKLGLLKPGVAAGALFVVTAASLGVALRHRVHAVAWATIIATLVTAAGLMWTSTTPTLFAALTVVLGVATVWFSYLLGWSRPRWLVSSVGNLLVLLLVLLALRTGDPLPGRPHPGGGPVMALGLALAAVYLGSFSVYTLRGRREAGGFEISQSLGVLLVGFLGAILVRRAHGGGVTALGAGALVAAMASYAIAFAFVRGRQGRGLNFFYYAWLGLVLAMLGTALVLPGRWLPYLWGILGVAAAVTGGRYDRWTLRLHCAAYLTGAVAYTGLPVVVFDAFLASAGETWHRLGLPGAVSWLLASLCYGLLVATQRERTPAAWRRLPRFLLAAIVLGGLGSQVVTFLFAALRGAVPGSEAALVAAVRSLVLAGTAVTLAAIARNPLFVELAWFVNPLLVVAGMKLLFEDLRRGTPATLFLGFACFGVALIVLPRLRRRQNRSEAPELGTESDEE